jgi:2-polyprenyl-3-methyl-5-hydroxy-6-metoxy-1,4-benzoquinol methylase
MGKEQPAKYYDKIYNKSGVYSLPANEIEIYFETWSKAYEYIKVNNIKDLIDLGCGAGHFPELFEVNKGINYLGVDFSQVAINKASAKKYKQGNTINYRCFDLSKSVPRNDFYTCFEFLEHISFDLDLMQSLSKGSEILFSVPNFDSAGHVRHFEQSTDVIDRYRSTHRLTLLHITKRNNVKLFLFHGVRV